MDDYWGIIGQNVFNPLNFKDFSQISVQGLVVGVLFKLYVGLHVDDNVPEQNNIKIGIGANFYLIIRVVFRRNFEDF